MKSQQSTIIKKGAMALKNQAQKNALAQSNSDLTALTGHQDEEKSIKLQNYAPNRIATNMDSHPTVNREFSNHVQVSGQNIPVNLSYKSSTNSLLPQKKPLPKVPSFDKQMISKSSQGSIKVALETKTEELGMLLA